MPPDILKIPNLVSLGRVLLLWPTAYFLALPGPEHRLYALVCLTLAGASDYLDGLLARRLKQETALGLILDPLADKIMASGLVILLIYSRAFPIWMAALIVGRDALILIGGGLIRRRLKTTVHSNLTGKYCFASIATLLVCYVAELRFCISLLTVLSLILIPLSFLSYGRTFIFVMKGRPAPVFADRLLWRLLRTAAVVIAIGICSAELILTYGK